jgi:hypothetical protein
MQFFCERARLALVLYLTGDLIFTGIAITSFNAAIAIKRLSPDRLREPAVRGGFRLVAASF